MDRRLHRGQQVRQRADVILVAMGDVDRPDAIASLDEPGEVRDDHVDPEQVSTPQRWRIGFIGRFMIVFGALSSAFDLLTFAVLHRVMHVSPELFRTAWFIESLLTELAVALVVRTRRPCVMSRPGHLLLMSTIGSRGTFLVSSLFFAAAAVVMTRLDRRRPSVQA